MFKKYTTEVALNAYVSWGAILKQDEFDHLVIPGDVFPQVYIIGKRPRISCDQNLFEINSDGLIKGVAIVHSRSGNKKRFFYLKVSVTNSDKLEVRSHYPYTAIEVFVNNKRLFSSNVSTILAKQPQVIDEDLDLEILYIGQSFSNSANYSIRKRLENHSTLQSIYAEAIKNFPTDEIWIGLFYFEQQSVLATSGMAGEIKVSSKEDKQHFERSLSHTVSDQQMVNYVEAALIKYFQPTYNKVFKKQFPSPAHSTYSECYDLDINTLAVVFASDCIGCRVYTDSRSPDIIHPAQFKLHSTDDRKSIFEGVI